MGGPTDFNYITPTKLKKIHPDIKESLDELKRRSRGKAKCSVCGQPAWKYAGTGMCFPCTTGESDASDDYELIEEI